MGRINPYELDDLDRPKKGAADVDLQYDTLTQYISSQTLGEAQERIIKAKPLLGPKTTVKDAMKGLLDAEMLLEQCLQCLQIVKALRHQCYETVSRSTGASEFVYMGTTYVLRHGRVIEKPAPRQIDEIVRI